jgi:hypothetical protein
MSLLIRPWFWLGGADTRQRNLVHDTVYRRVRATVMRGVHAIDDVASHLGRRRVRLLFEAASPVSLSVFRPVLQHLARDPRLEFWFMTSDRSWGADRIFGAAGIRNRVISTAQARWMKFDGYINTDFWNTTWLPRRARCAHLFHGVAGKYGLDAPVHIAPVVASFDRLLFPNRDRLVRYAEAGLIDRDGRKARLVGHPKVDCLVDGSLNRRAIQRALGLDTSVPTVLYAPTWSPYSSLNAAGYEVITGLGRLDVNVIVKLHDRSLDATQRGSGGVNWVREFDGLSQRQRRLHFARDADASPYLFVADALVTDHSSVGFEFMLLDRPLVTIDCPELIRKARINPDKVALLRSASRVVSRGVDVSGATSRALADPRAFSDRRRSIAQNLFYAPGGAAARAARALYELLDLEAPDLLAVPKVSTWTETCSATRGTGI